MYFCVGQNSLEKYSILMNLFSRRPFWKIQRCCRNMTARSNTSA
ncbi:hypothetical protein [Klebsiella variicola]